MCMTDTTSKQRFSCHWKWETPIHSWWHLVSNAVISMPWCQFMEYINQLYNTIINIHFSIFKNTESHMFMNIRYLSYYLNYYMLIIWSILLICYELVYFLQLSLCANSKITIKPSYEELCKMESPKSNAKIFFFDDIQSTLLYGRRFQRFLVFSPINQIKFYWIHHCLN